MLSGICMMQFFVGGGLPSGADKGSAPIALVGLAAGAAFASLAVRYLVIPSRTDIRQQLTGMIIGLALAEFAGIVGLIVVPGDYPQTKLWIFTTAIACMILHAPVYAKQRPAA